MRTFWQKANHLFFEIPMTWLRVILYALLTGVLVGGVMCIPGLGGYSIENPGVCYEIWVILALWVILNCQKPVEAGLKTFVYFLISQPVIYLVQVPFSWQGWNLFSYYPFWFLLTVLTFPGGMIAWYVKKRKWYSPVILAVALAIIMMMEFPEHLETLIFNAPKQLFACIFILLEAVFLIFLVIKDRRQRLALLCISALFAITGSLLFTQMLRHGGTTDVQFLPEGREYTVEAQEGEAEVTLSGNILRVTMDDYGSCRVRLLDEEGNEYLYEAEYSRNMVESYISSPR